MVAAAYYSHALTAAVSILLTSGIWLAVYLTSNRGSQTTYNTYNNGLSNCTTNSYEYVTYNIGNGGIPTNNNTCTQPAGAKCTDTCEFVICESIPAGLQFDPKYKVFNKTTDCWMRLMAEAKDEILLGSYYWNLLVVDTGDNYTVDTTNTSGDGLLIYNTLLSTALRGIDIRIAQTYQPGGYNETTQLELNSNGKIKVRSLDFKQWYPGGILHTKTWSVDKKHFYVGSANFDWRSLTQVKELGLAAFNCPCLAEDVSRILEVYWAMGAPGAKIPQQWPDNYTALANQQQPTSIPQPQGNPSAYFSVSPPGFQSCGREDDLTAMVKVLDAAQDYVNLAVMDYAPSTLYNGNNNFYFPTLDDAIRRAAFDRRVKIQFLMSYWPHTKKSAFSYMYSLMDLSDELPCVYTNNTCAKKGSIEVRIVEVPPLQYGSIPYARVYHNKYMVSEKTAYVGTSNWSADYWLYTAGIGVAVSSDDTTQKNVLVEDFNSIFLRDWNSNYTLPLSAWDRDGNRVTK